MSDNTIGERRPDWRGEATTFVDKQGVERVVIAVDHYTGEPGYYGGVSPNMYERNGFSCGARYYFGEAVAELGIEVKRDTGGARGMTYRIDMDNLTVIATDAAGEDHDLNASGEPCETTTDLADFVRELYEQSAFDIAVRDELLSKVQ